MRNITFELSDEVTCMQQNKKTSTTFSQFELEMSSPRGSSNSVASCKPGSRNPQAQAPSPSPHAVVINAKDTRQVCCFWLRGMCRDMPEKCKDAHECTGRGCSKGTRCPVKQRAVLRLGVDE